MDEQYPLQENPYKPTWEETIRKTEAAALERHIPGRLPFDSYNHEIDGGNTPIRTFSTGATRDTADGKLDYEGFLSPIVLEAFARYMHENRKMKDGSLRASDNWQKGIPLDAYASSMFRHFMDVWSIHRGYTQDKPEMEEALCALLFNVMGYLHELHVR